MALFPSTEPESGESVRDLVAKIVITVGSGATGSVYRDTNPSNGDELYDLLGKWIEVLLSAYPSAENAGGIYSSNRPSLGDDEKDRWAKVLTIYNAI